MSDGFQFIDIILFAMIAAFLVLRLRSVLGRRDGHEGRFRDPFKSKPGEEAVEDKVIPLADRTKGYHDEGAAMDVGGETEAAGDPLSRGLAAIRAADPSFNRDDFLTGARDQVRRRVDRRARLG